MGRPLAPPEPQPLPHRPGTSSFVYSLFTKTCLTLALTWTPLSAVSADQGDPKSVYLARVTAIAQLDDSQLQDRVSEDPKSLGSISIGKPNNGRLLNGVRPEDGGLFELVAPDFAWGTEETVGYLSAAVKKVHEEHPKTLPVHLGHISKPSGGYLSPHLSHQSGRDVDLGFYYKAKRAWYRRGTHKTLDVPRTWSLVRALVTETDVEMILIDYSIQKLLREHALKIGEDKEWVHALFKGDAERPRIIRHVRGHATHIHVRFFNPVAQTLAQRAYPHLLDAKLVEPVTVYVHHRARKGDSLGKLARIYGSSVKAIQRANGLRSTVIQARKVYKIPKRGGPSPLKSPLEFPTRRMPPPAPAG